jgi:hypothetical protein
LGKRQTSQPEVDNSPTVKHIIIIVTNCITECVWSAVFDSSYVTLQKKTWPLYWNIILMLCFKLETVGELSTSGCDVCLFPKLGV